MDRLNISYKEFHNGVIDVLNQYDPHCDGDMICDEVFAFSRGGLLAGVIASHRLGVPLTVLEWSTRDHVKRQLNTKIIDMVNNYGNHILLIDDINDSGETLNSFFEAHALPMNARNVKVACVYEKPQSTFKVDYKYKTVDNDLWLDFPFENSDEV